MNGYDRRHFLTSAITASALSVGAPWLQPRATAAGQARHRIKVGQIGIGHNHASAKMATFRNLSDQYEVVGVVEPDAQWRKKRASDPAYRDVPWMTEQQLLNTKGLAVVAVETDVCDLVPTAARCIAAGMHLHLDKPGGESLAPFKRLLDEAGRRNLAVQMGYRQLVVCGDEGTIDIRPLETFDTGSAQPLKLRLALSKPRDSYTKGYQEVVFPPMPGRYNEQLRELVRIVRGEIANPCPLAHELMVQETLLAAIDHPRVNSAN